MRAMSACARNSSVARARQRPVNSSFLGVLSSCRPVLSHRVCEQYYEPAAILAAKLLKLRGVLEICDSAWRPFDALASPCF